MASCEAQKATGLAFQDSHAKIKTEEAGLPAGFPQAVKSELAWTANDFVNEDEYILVLKEEEVAELESALDVFNTYGLDGDLITKETFPLPTLGPKLDKMRRDIHQGKGFGVVRGLDAKKYCVEDLTMLYIGIQVYIASEHGRQDRKGNMLVHIIADDSSPDKTEHHRHSTAPITFHNEEAGDLVSWLTRSTAATGGKCIIASSYTVYNVLCAERPDLIRALAGSDWPFALPNFHCRPVLFNCDGRLIMNFGRTPLMGSASYPRPDNLPALSDRQREALDAIEKIARATELEITTKAGDVHFINNLAILHRREGFVDGSSTTEKRHLVRMRLRDSEMGWTIPEELKFYWSKAFDEDVCDSFYSASRLWHLEPMPKGYFPLRYHPN